MSTDAASMRPSTLCTIAFVQKLQRFDYYAPPQARLYGIVHSCAIYALGGPPCCGWSAS